MRRIAFVLSLLKDTRGATAIEYALIASLISIGIVSGAISVGTSLTSTFNSVANAL